jgi:hypothetical protein
VGSCGLLLDEGCSLNSRCDLMSYGSETKCRENFYVKNDYFCIKPFCITIGNECVYDNCHSYDKRDCNLNLLCVFSSVSNCQTAVCSDIDVYNCSFYKHKYYSFFTTIGYNVIGYSVNHFLTTPLTIYPIVTVLTFTIICKKI